MHIAILGTRGIPANYGGFETFAEELSVRLADRGHDVTVYCREASYEERISEYRGVKLVTLSSIHTKYFDTLSATLIATSAAKSTVKPSLHAARKWRSVESGSSSGLSNARVAEETTMATVMVAVNAGCCTTDRQNARP